MEGRRSEREVEKRGEEEASRRVRRREDDMAVGRGEMVQLAEALGGLLELSRQAGSSRGYD